MVRDAATGYWQFDVKATPPLGLVDGEFGECRMCVTIHWASAKCVWLDSNC